MERTGWSLTRKVTRERPPRLRLRRSHPSSRGGEFRPPKPTGRACYHNSFFQGVHVIQARRTLFKYYDLVMALFVTILLCSNVIGAAKVATVWGFTFGAGVLFFPISYIFNDVLTEVYGYARARKVVWAGFGAIIFASFMSWVVVTLPLAQGWNDQGAYEMVLG